MLVLIVFYTLTVSFLLQLSYDVELILHSAHALAWCIFHCFGLGLLLRAQGERKFLVRHFMKHYYYPPNDGGIGAIQEAFTNWKSIYNLSLCMTYGAYIKVVALSFFHVYGLVSFIGLVWKTYSFPSEWTVGNDLLRHTLGVVRFSALSPSSSSLI